MLRNCFLGLLLLCSLLLPETSAQTCINGQCQLRTPLRTAVSNVVTAAPLRRTVNAVRPANWRVFNQSAAQCSGPQVASCSGSQVTTVIYETVAPTPAEVSSTVQMTDEVSTMGVISDRIKFRQVVLREAKEALERGELTTDKYYWLRASLRFPRVLDQVHDSVIDIATEEGYATASAIDWEGIADFIERILPLILKLIELFGSTVSTSLSSVA